MRSIFLNHLQRLLSYLESYVSASFVFNLVIGRGGGIRTRGLLVPNQALYQAKLRPEQKAEFGRNCQGVKRHNWDTFKTALQLVVLRVIIQPKNERTQDPRRTRPDV